MSVVYCDMGSASSYKRHLAPEGHDNSRHETNLRELRSRISDGASRGSPYSNAASNHSTQTPAEEYRARIKRFSCRSITQLGNFSVDPLSVSSTAKWEDSFFHLLMTNRASSDEIVFIITAEWFGLNAAIDLATKFHWRCQRPLQALRAMLSEPGKSYTKRSATRKLPLGSPASSRRRS